MALLNGAERERAERFRRRVDSDRFMLGVALSRLALGRRLGMRPQEVPIVRDCPSCGAPHGKPRTDGIEFSVSHGGDLVGVAVSRRAVGLDVEPVDGRADLEELVPLTLSPRERQWWLTVHRDRKTECFLRNWVRKEAALKAVGIGLRYPMTRIDTLGDGPWAARIDFDAGSTDVIIKEADAAPGHVAAVAVVGGVVPVVRIHVGEVLLTEGSSHL